MNNQEISNRNAQAIEFLKKNKLENEYPFSPHFIEQNGVYSHYVDKAPNEKSDEVLLFVHGNPTWSFAWRELIKPLSQKHRCIAVDHVGCGLSDKPQDYRYELSQHIENLQNLIETLKLENITLVAHDWGGAIGTGAAGRMPERFKRLVLMNTAAFRSQMIPFRIALCRIPLLGTLGVRGFNLFARAAIRMAVNESRPMSETVARGFLAPYDNWNHRIAIDRFVKDIPLRKNHPSYSTLLEVEENLSRLSEHPKLFTWGMKDWCFTPKFLDVFLEHFPNAKTKPFENSGHYLFEEQPEKLVQLISSFIEEN